ncbi:T9SS type A sorting domain-containing protein [Pseudochryseolinea flava]|uniref:Secretion system C-terminal sorting domain-containing protein n=1 Tax=Pseudochryseolinea flava TaxID=2059302 RepID=A0A364Y2D8_9BACT|nr:T9SS type A sorting domain-containing protein [Pseudochryseolinea flava]RAW01035.1 hypothetical protein DQQ10_12440 [Pseudochryseolinea flava]
MKKLLLMAFLIFPAGLIFGQGFEVVSLQDSYKGLIGETVRVPIRFKNTTDKTIILIVRKVTAQLGSTQKSFFCLGNDCFDSKIEDYIIKVEPGQVQANLQVALEAGLVPGVSTVRYVAFSKSSPNQTLEFDVNFNVEENAEKQNIFISKEITVKDIYPNPVIENAYIDYHLTSERVKAKIVVHNLLGNTVGEYALPIGENVVRIKVEDVSAGIYFYTLYLNNESVFTRKMMIRK